jgi:type I restriction enzyme S subunit
VSAVLDAREPSARYLEAVPPTLVRQFDLLATAQGGAERLREVIVLLALQGKLVEQNPQEASALDWLATIKARRDTLSAKRLVKPGKNLPLVEENERSFDLPATWTWARLDDIVVSSEAGWSPSCPETPRRGERWGVLKVSAVSWGKFDPAANKELPDELAPRPEYEVRSGDFLLSRANTAELVARSVVVDEAPPRLMLSDKIIRLTFAEGVNRAFINLCNNSGAARNYYVAKASGTSSSMKNVSREVVLGLPIPVPPVDEQARIVTRVDELVRLCDALEAKGRLEAEQHARLLGALLGTLTDSSTPEELAASWQRVADHFDLLLDRPEAVDALEETILHLAVRGLLVPQDQTEEPAGELLTRTREHKMGLINAGEVRAGKPVDEIAESELPFGLPRGWAWARFGDITINRDGERVPVSSSDRERRAKVYDYYGASGVIDKIDGYLFDKTLLLIGEDGANLLNRSTPIAFLAHGKYWVNNHAHVIDTMDAGLMRYLELFVNAISLEPYVTGTAQPKMNQAKLNSIVVALPPLLEQSRIVARVTELRRLCSNLRERLAASQTTQSHLAEALVDEMA